MSAPPATVVIGVGNPLRGDDGIGPAVIDALRRRAGPAGPDVRLVCCSGDLTELIEAWEHADSAIVIDAVASGAAPGSVHVVPLEDRSWGQLAQASSHGLGVQEAAGLARQLGRLPGALVLVGVEAAQFDLGAPLSAPVRLAVEQVVALVEHDLGQHAPGQLSGVSRR